MEGLPGNLPLGQKPPNLKRNRTTGAGQAPDSCGKRYERSGRNQDISLPRTPAEPRAPVESGLGTRAVENHPSVAHHTSARTPSLMLSSQYQAVNIGKAPGGDAAFA
jgi:hypothetical protein